MFLQQSQKKHGIARIVNNKLTQFILQYLRFLKWDFHLFEFFNDSINWSTKQLSFSINGMPWKNLHKAFYLQNWSNTQLRFSCYWNYQGLKNAQLDNFEFWDKLKAVNKWAYCSLSTHLIKHSSEILMELNFKRFKKLLNYTTEFFIWDFQVREVFKGSKTGQLDNWVF